MLSAAVACLALVLTLLLIYRSLWNVVARLLFGRRAVRARPFLLASCRKTAVDADRETPGDSSSCSVENDRRGPGPGDDGGASSCPRITESDDDTRRDESPLPSVVCTPRRGSLPALDERRSAISRRRSNSGDARFRGRARERNDRNDWRSRSRSRSPSHGGCYKRRLFADSPKNKNTSDSGTVKLSNGSSGPSNGFGEVTWPAASGGAWPSYKICLLGNVNLVNGRTESCVLPLPLPNTEGPFDASDVAHQNGPAPGSPCARLDPPRRRNWSDIDATRFASAGTEAPCFDGAGVGDELSDGDFSADSLDDAVLDVQLMSLAVTRPSSPFSPEQSRPDSPLSRSLQKACSDVEDLRNHFMEMIDCLLREDVRVTVPYVEDATSNATCSVLLTESVEETVELRTPDGRDRVSSVDASTETMPLPLNGRSSTGLELGARPKERSADRRCVGLRRPSRRKRERPGDRASRTLRIRRSNIWV
ncbi:hypothetical protein CRV163 [Nile crocodilepox virus]|uniref:Uncharacterized protein n=1 Tax=Nile crocodilepox virus (isolate Crocodylus niloticus/Zimbabwe/Ume/2001) TaxID=1289473 RepID=Q06ZY8_CPRVZ|nr:hypothetical protein CRV163 [Nile crocodilepox virus]ABJ09054.1 hypothetical protein CRV163 [Nile crocodilepox virus]